MFASHGRAAYLYHIMKKVLAIIAGVVSGFLIVFVGDAVIHALHPMPLGLNYMDKTVMMNYVENIPKYLLVMMVCFWALSAFIGGLVATLIEKVQWKSACMSTGGILLAAAMLNLIMTAPSHPLWMWVAALVLYLPSALLGGWLIARKRPVSTV